jgi:hypothetical protein
MNRQSTKPLSNYHQLRAIADDLTLVSHSSPGVVYLFKKKIRDFFDSNAANIIRMTKFHDGIVKEFVEHEEKEGESVPKMDEKGNYVFISEEAAKQYSEQYDTFFNQNVIIL